MNYVGIGIGIGVTIGAIIIEDDDTPEDVLIDANDDFLDDGTGDGLAIY